VLGCVLLVVAVLTVTLVRAVAVVARHRAESAADLAALAAAGRIGTSGAPCSAAATSAAGNLARLISCDVRLDADGRSGTVAVRVQAAVTIPVVGAQLTIASARAGRLPGGDQRDPRPTAELWHAFAGTAPVCNPRAGLARGWLLRGTFRVEAGRC
jgi:secretion/DNA translocation related TadE-like protein